MRMTQKFMLKMQPEQNIDMPEDMVIVHVIEERGEIAIYAFVDPERKVEPRTFMLFSTGQPIADADANYLEYVSTLLIGGVLVSHLFIWEGLRK
jgi:hypothetical protein